MAAVTQVLHDSKQGVIVYVTNDAGTAVTLACADFTNGGTANELWIERIQAATSSQAIDIMWDASTDVLAWKVPSESAYDHDFSRCGGLKNISGTGKTGSILLNSIGWASTDGYAIVLYLIKKFT